MSVPARISLVVLGVADVARSCSFYEALGWRRSSASNDEITFLATADSVLGLFERGALAADAGVPAAGEGFRGFTLAINLESREAVDLAAREMVGAGATLVKPPVAAVWGGYSGYVADPDGHLWELAHNPFFPFTADGSVALP